MKNIALIGYSGHAYVAFEIFFSQGMIVSAYTDLQEKASNPFALKYLGSESDAAVLDELKKYTYFVATGDNKLRRSISQKLEPLLGPAENALHKTAIISRSMNAGSGNMFAPRCVINPLVRIGNGVICNTGSIIEHECVLHDFVHVAPGAILCGDVTVGEGTFVGAGSVVRQGIRIGSNVMIGAGTVVVKDVPDNCTVIGNPQKMI
jgi:sugar O-acyltransferase (sialic acid O-acetyltransferase NeuD family)